VKASQGTESQGKGFAGKKVACSDKASLHMSGFSYSPSFKLTLT
jgi:hypothetical protein